MAGPRVPRQRDYIDLLERLDAFLADPPLSDRAALPARKEVAALVDKTIHTVRKKSRDALATEAGEPRDLALHDARRAAKRSRYAADVYAVHDAAPAKAVATQMTELQDTLGDRQDGAVMALLLRDFAARTGAAGGNGVHLRVPARARGGPRTHDRAGLRGCPAEAATARRLTPDAVLVRRAEVLARNGRRDRQPQRSVRSRRHRRCSAVSSRLQDAATPRGSPPRDRLRRARWPRPRRCRPPATPGRSRGAVRRGGADPGRRPARRRRTGWSRRPADRPVPAARPAASRRRPHRRALTSPSPTRSTRGRRRWQPRRAEGPADRRRRRWELAARQTPIRSPGRDGGRYQRDRASVINGECPDRTGARRSVRTSRARPRPYSAGNERSARSPVSST